jgi:hypothetical protein
MTTGKHELDIKDLVDKLGSMANTGKCCATGTCDNYVTPHLKAPLIPTSRDSRDAFSLAQAYGSLVS